jgi:hypothetical protein
MTRFTKFLGIALISAAVSAEPQQSPQNENERQPGTLRISGVNDTDRVLLDGELIGDGKRIAQFGSKLLVNPGEYTVTILSASQQSCESRVHIRENRTATATCSTDRPEEFVD